MTVQRESRSARWRLGLTLAVTSGVVLATAGCSLGTQASALTAVSGDREALVRAAAQDILVDKSIRVHVWPQCTSVGKAISCKGNTVNGAEITVESPATSPVTMTVTEGGQTLYSGEVQPVIDKAAGQSS